MATVKIWVKAKNPNNSFVDLGQGVIISGYYPKEVDKTLRIKQGIDAGAIQEITEEDADKLTVKVNAMIDEFQASKAKKLQADAAFATAQADANNAGKPDGDAESEIECRARLNSHTVKELLLNVAQLDADTATAFTDEKTKKAVIVDWLVANGGCAFPPSNYCGVPRTPDHAVLMSKTAAELKTAADNLVQLLTDAKQLELADHVNSVKESWLNSGKALNSKEYCGLMAVMIDAGWKP